MATAEFSLQPVASLELLQKCIETAADLFGSERIGVRIETSLLTDHVAVDGVPANALKEQGPIASLKQTLESSNGIIDLKTVRLSGNNNTGSFVYATGDGIIATLKLEVQNNQVQAGRLQEMLTVSIKRFVVVRKSEFLLRFLPEPQRQVMQAYEVAVRDLTANVAKLGSILADEVPRQQKILEEKSAALESRFEAKVLAQESDHQRRMKLLDEREVEVAKKEKDILYMQPAARRRENVQRLINQFNERLTAAPVTAATKATRKPVHILCWFLLASSISGIALLIRSAEGAAKTDWQIYAFVSAMTVISAGTAIFYVRFLSNWFSELAHSEFTTKKMLADAARADYVVDLFMETSTKDNPVPVTVLKSMLRDLFTEPSQSTVRHPIEDVLSKTPSSLKAKFGSNGADVEFKK